MNSFVFVSLTALLLYVFLFATMLVSRRNRQINAFLLVLGTQILWVGGSCFMRLRMVPSVAFWYHVSLTGMWMILYTLIRYLNEYMNRKSSLLDKVLTGSIVLSLIINAVTGVFLDAPEAILQADGSFAFVYHPTNGVYVMYAIAVLGILRVAYLIVSYSLSDKEVFRQFLPIIVGLCTMLLGNALIMLPMFEGIPIDIVSGVFNALCMFWMLYQRRLFKLTLLVSRRSCYIICSVVTFVLFANFISPMEQSIDTYMPMLSGNRTLVIAVTFTVCVLILTALFRVVIDHIFIKEEQSQARLLSDFSMSVSRSLELKDILARLIDVTEEGLGINWACVCTPREGSGDFEVTLSNNPLENGMKVFSGGNPIVRWFTRNDQVLMSADLHRIPEYRSMWEEEKHQLQILNVRCFVPLVYEKDLVGVMLLSGKVKKARYTYNDISFLTSVRTVASVSIKNALLYERVSRDARTDDLSGLINRKYFHKTLEDLTCDRQRAITLMIVSLDDFKLYNQLYGNAEGDLALRACADVINSAAGERGVCARYSGKEFAVILPDCDQYTASALAREISRRIGEIDRTMDGGAHHKQLTVSVGICAIPTSAATAKQLVDNAEMAVYQAKRAGKNGIRLYSEGLARESTHISPDGSDRQTIYSEYAPTIYALTAAIDTKDHYTFGHSKNVAYYATALAEAYGLNPDSVEIINEAALLHDVGKIGVPEHILNKPGRLTESEYTEMKKHVENSISIIRHLPSLDYVIPAVIGHHEHYDGTGYPRRIAGEDIPLYARILCIADSFDAITSDRVYREGRKVEAALEILRDQEGRQFDPYLTELFISEYRQGRIKLQRIDE